MSAMPDNPLRAALAKAAGDAGPVPAAPSHPYIIFMTPRSGSTWLAELMRAHGLGFPDEWLNHARMGQEIQRCRRRDLGGYLIETLARHAGPSGASGVEVPLLQLMQAYELDNIFDVLGPRTRYLYLRRRNIVRQAISLYVARETGVYHASDANQPYARPSAEITYSASAIEDCMKRVLHDELWFERMLIQQQVQPFRLDYESLKAEPDSMLAAIANHLGAQPVNQQSSEQPGAPVTHPSAAHWEANFVRENAAFLDRVAESRPRI